MKCSAARGCWRPERHEARAREPREAHDRIGLNGRGARTLPEDRHLAELVSRTEARDLDRAATHVGLALEHEVHVLALVALAEQRPCRPGRAT